MDFIYLLLLCVDLTLLVFHFQGFSWLTNNLQGCPKLKYIWSRQEQNMKPVAFSEPALKIVHICYTVFCHLGTRKIKSR